MFAQLYQKKTVYSANGSKDKGLIYPPQILFIRVFKQEKVLEVWTLSRSDGIFKKIFDYPICRTSGILGPKRREGDLQIPEGFYYIERFNPKSNFYLSLGINYPNHSDQIFGKKGNLGGDIFLHGGCATIGCIPITDEYIKEVYLLAVQTKSNGQEKIPVHIFPAKLDRPMMTQLRKTYNADATLVRFWENLQIGYQWFEKHRNLPKNLSKFRWHISVFNFYFRVKEHVQTSETNCTSTRGKLR